MCRSKNHMSSFITPIPIDLAAIKKLLPTNSDILGVEWNAAKSRMELRWSNDRLKTPFTFHHEFPLTLLKKKSLPANTELLDPPATPQKKTVDSSRENAEKKA